MLEIERAFRMVNGRIDVKEHHQKQRETTNNEVVNGLKDQVAEFERKRRLIYGAHIDLQQKVDDIKQTIKEREAEKEDLREVLKGKKQLV